MKFLRILSTVNRLLTVFVFLTLLFACFCGSAEPRGAAYAADSPYIKIGSDVWLSDTETGRRLFVLPETYYAAVDGIVGDYYYVTFNGVTGRVPKESVSVTGYHTTAPGTVREIKIDSKYHIFTEIKLKSSMDGVQEDYPVPTNESLFFLGKYPADDMWYYVKYNENCGYIKAEYTTVPELDEGRFVPEQPAPPPTDDEPAEEPQGDTGLVKILVITGVCVAAVALIIIIFIPKKRTKSYYYETES